MTQADKNALISARIIAKVSEGMSVKDAYDFVMGSGAYAKLAGEIYDEINSFK